MNDISEKYGVIKKPLNTIQKTGFWFLVSSIVLGFGFIYLEYLIRDSWDSYWEVAQEIDNEFLYYMVTNDIFLIFVLLGFFLLFLVHNESKKVHYISAIALSILVLDRFLHYFGVWNENEIYWDYHFLLIIIYYLLLGIILWFYYKNTSRSKVPFYIFSYGAISFLILIINANVTSLGINETVFNLLYFSALISILVVVSLEIHFLMKHYLIININSRGEEKMGTYENRISNIILTTGKTYVVLSVIGAFLLLGFLEDFDNAIKFTLIIVGLGYSFLFSLIFFGAAEVIELLHQNNKKTEELIRLQKKSIQPNEFTKQKPVSEDFEDLPEL